MKTFKIVSPLGLAFIIKGEKLTFDHDSGQKIISWKCKGNCKFEYLAIIPVDHLVFEVQKDDN